MAAAECRTVDRVPRSNLPVAPTPLVGREREINDARERLVRPEVRLLTFTGPGGTGKTRLALAVAASLAETFADGVHFVDLAPLRDPTLVHATIAHSLGIRDAGDQPLLETLRLYLQSRELLLLLDNFEQVIAAAPLVPDLLAACPSLKIAATSREPLHLSWEHEWPVPPLALPASSAGRDRDQIALSPAVSLFVARAQAVVPDFRLTDANARLIADVCARLDGLPLAIELAAARVKLLPLAAIHARLQQSLLLLASGPRDAPSRQHTLRASIAWSYGLLDPAEQATFRRLAIFVGGFTIDAAEAVGKLGKPDLGGWTSRDQSSVLASTASAPAIDAPQQRASTLDHIGSLLDKNLLRSDAPFANDGAEARYRMLETIRAFGLEQLALSGELIEIRERHTRYFLALAEEGERQIIIRSQAVWLDRLEAEHDNLRAALEVNLSSPEGTEIAARLARALGEFWILRGHYGSGRAWHERVLTRASETGLPQKLWLRLLYRAAFLAWRQGDPEVAVRICETGIARGEHANEPGELAGCLGVRGLVATHQSQLALAHTTLGRGLALAREADDDRMVAWILGFSATLSCIEGKYVQARALGEECLGIFQNRDEPWGIAIGLGVLAAVARREGNYRLAQSLYEESIVASQAIGDRGAVAVSLANLGHVARELGDNLTARARYRESLQIHREVGDRRGAALVLGNLGVIAERAGDLDGAREHLEQSLAIARAVGDKRHAEVAHDHLARVLAKLTPPFPPRAPFNGRNQPLSRREREIAVLIARGLTNRAIAENLIIAERTVDTHVSNILGKLGLKTRAQIAAWAVEHDLTGARIRSGRRS